MADLHAMNNQKREKSLWNFIHNFYFLFCIVVVLNRIILMHKVDDLGMGFLAVPMELYLLSVFMFSMPMQKTISGLMKVRMKREQYKNALKISRYGYLMLIIPAVLLGIVFTAASSSIATAFQVNLSWMAISATGITVFFAIMTGGSKGFLMGVASPLILLIGQAVEIILFVVCSLVGADFGVRYGTKISALLKNENMIAAYGALGIMLGILVMQIITFVYWSVLHICFRKAFSVKLREDFNRREDDGRTCISVILYNMFPTTVSAFVSQVFILVGQFLYMRNPGAEETTDRIIAFWGCFYAKYLPLMMLPITICVYCMSSHAIRLVSAYEKEDGRALRDRTERGLIKLNAISVSGMVFVSLLGQAFAGTFYSGMNSSILKVISAASALIICYCYYYCMHSTLQRLQYHGESVLILIGSAIIGLIAFIVLCGKMDKGLIGTAISMCIFYTVAAVAAGLRVYARIRCRVSLLYSFAYPILAACISGIVILLLNRMLIQFAGAAATLIVCLIIGYLVDIFVLMAFHVLNESQIRAIPGGFVIASVGRAIGVL